MTIIPFFKEVLTLPYVSNVKNCKHEKLIKAKLIKYKLTFEYQPHGSQRSPDFRINLGKQKFLDIELKSSKQSYPTFNGGLPKKGVVYIFCSKKYNETTIFFGQDIINDDKRQRYHDLITELKKVVSKHQNISSWRNDPRGFDFYMRNMFIQKGGITRVDYFKHLDRAWCEHMVFQRLRSDYY